MHTIATVPPEGRAVCKTYFSFLLVYVILILGIYFFFPRHTRQKKSFFYFARKNVKRNEGFFRPVFGLK
ncbi:hypothetical protein BSI_29390 [Bacillus inaquosorum KCTC 13429]|uniref:Uncharacterized protein n=1 Tax=Bacillus inaquosorum KCTC 13429 TaxID=1236548 RepID=A0A9W5LGZ4_9BACI|nr:hypothetical protein BSI_29390 [Bacillus inaquosorum KCTC 13429]